MRRTWRAGGLGLVACVLGASGCDSGREGRVRPDAVLLSLAPDVVSSEDGSLQATAVVVERTSPRKGWNVRLQVSFTDQLGNLRTIGGTTQETDRTGSVRHVFEGLTWAGAGTVTAEVLDDDGEPYLGRDDEPLVSEATFAVIDLSPPTVEILPVTSDLRVGPDLPLDVIVRFADEMGVSNVTLQAVGELEATRTRIVASGSSAGDVVFTLDVPGNAIPGPNITLYALAEDLSGNVAAAEPVTLTVDPSILIAVAAGLTASETSVGAANYLSAPRAIAFSPRDELLYVADNSAGACSSGCIWQVDPSDGTATLVTPVAGAAEGLAFDATGDFLYVSDRPDRIVRLTYDAGMGTYVTPTLCHSDTVPPQAPAHLVVDGTTVLFAEQGDDVLKQLDVTDCLGAADTTDATDLSDTIDTPWGVEKHPGGGYLVSSAADDRILSVAADGTTEIWETARIDRPLGIAWMVGGILPEFADSLFVASHGDRRVYSTRGLNTARTAVSLGADPVDIAVGSGAWEGVLFVLVEQGPGGGRIFAIDGF